MTLVPSIARIEIRMSDKAGLKNTANRLARLAEQISNIATSGHDDATANLLAYEWIKTVSQDLRKGK